jgi:hypothetical protein
VNVHVNAPGTALSGLVLRVRVRADGRTKRARVPARVSRSGIRLASTLVEFGEPQ